MTVASPKAMPLQDVPITVEPIERFTELVGKARVDDAVREAAEIRSQLGDRVVWNVNSTATGGGVAEMLRAILPYARGAGIDTRWVVVHGPPEFFRVTKRLHNALHGELGDGSPLDDAARKVYDEAARANAAEMLALVCPGDVVILHDPQTAGLAPTLARVGAKVIWRCHIGTDEANAETARGWAFLAPYLRDVPAFVFTRASYVPVGVLDPARCAVIAPSIDPFSAKNQAMAPEVVRAVLAHVGLIDPAPGDGEPAPVFRRADGSLARVVRTADVLRHGRPPRADTPLVAQVSRWDRLKDPLGVLEGFGRLACEGVPSGAMLLLVGPNVRAVADDPEGAEVFEEVLAAWRALPQGCRSLVHLVHLPMADVEENAAIVNAIQRHAAVVVQKSLREGFGLTVTEAMWKARPVIASAVGGIQDQITDGVDGLLLRDPRDLDAFGGAVARVLGDPALARQLGERAYVRARDHFLGVRHLLQYAALINRMRGAATAAAGGSSAAAMDHAAE